MSFSTLELREMYLDGQAHFPVTDITLSPQKRLAGHLFIASSPP
jgi:hypothetical protein